ncbi:MAG: MarR family transcriptional regulator [Georgfuchsia sp.]
MKSDQQETFGFLLRSVRLSLLRRGERLLASRGFDINITQYRVLKALSKVQSMSCSELALSVEHDGGALTRVLDRLQEKGYVARRPNMADRRAIEVFMTDQGRAAWDSIKNSVTQVNAEVFAVLSDAEQTQLFGLLHRIRDRLDAHAEQ